MKAQVDYTEGKLYSNLDELLLHSLELSLKIERTATKKEKLNEFQERVLEVAKRPGMIDPDTNVHKVTEITQALLRKGEKLEDIRQKVQNTLYKLKKKGHLKTGRTRRIEVVHDPRVEDNIGIVQWLLKNKFQNIHPLNYAEALEAGKLGLQYALKTYNPITGFTLNTYAELPIKWHLERAKYYKRVDARQRGPSLEEIENRASIRDAQDKALEMRAKLDALVEGQIRRKRINEHHALLWTLVNIHGFSGPELSKYYNTSPQAITKRVRQAEHYLNIKMQQREE